MFMALDNSDATPFTLIGAMPRASGWACCTRPAAHRVQNARYQFLHLPVSTVRSKSRTRY